MARNIDEGLKSDALRSALKEAIAGKSTRLEELLATHSFLPSPKPNLKLAAAFGAEVAAMPGVLAPLLTRLGADDAAPHEPRAFLPIVAAHGWAARIREKREVEPAWSALAELAADERAPVRLGALDALLTIGIRAGGADTLVMRGSAWLDTEEDRELRFGAAATLIELLGDRAVLATLEDEAALLAYLDAAIELVVNAARAAERSDGRRRILMSLPRTLAAVALSLRAGDRGVAFLREHTARATHPDLRHALSGAIANLRNATLSEGAVESLRQSLDASAKPVRDQARVRVEPGKGRGRRSRHSR